MMDKTLTKSGPSLQNEVDIRCPGCGRYQFTMTPTDDTHIRNIKCKKCKATLEVKGSTVTTE